MSTTNSGKNTIPRIIHLLCREKTKASANLGSIKELHKDWTFILYDDRDMDLFIWNHFPEMARSYNAFHTGIQRRDLFRMLAVYRTGGFYMDTNIQCIKPLDTLLCHLLVLGEEKTLSPAEMALPHHKHPLRIANYMFGGVPRHPFLLSFVQQTLQSSRKPVRTENDVLETTGPGALTNYYHEHQSNFPDIYLLRNPGLRCKKNCCRQFFLPFWGLCRTPAFWKLALGVQKLKTKK